MQTIPTSAWSTIISQGGFAVLAAFAIGTIFQISKMWVADVKASAEREKSLIEASTERERLLTQKVLDLVAQVTSTIADNSGKIASLTTEIQGLRTVAHNTAHVVGAVPNLELRVTKLEARRT